MEVVVQTIISSLSLGSFYALGALGIGLLFGVLRLINFAHGDFITVGGFSLIVPATAVVAVPLILDFHRWRSSSAWSVWWSSGRSPPTSCSSGTFRRRRPPSS